MKRNSTIAEVARIPSCDFCTAPAKYDSKMRDRSSWAYMCDPHWRLLGIGRLGLGFGQELVIREAVSS